MLAVPAPLLRSQAALRLLRGGPGEPQLPLQRLDLGTAVEFLIRALVGSQARGPCRFTRHRQ